MSSAQREPRGGSRAFPRASCCSAVVRPGKQPLCNAPRRSDSQRVAGSAPPGQGATRAGSDTAAAAEPTGPSPRAVPEPGSRALPLRVGSHHGGGCAQPPQPGAGPGPEGTCNLLQLQGKTRLRSAGPAPREPGRGLFLLPSLQEGARSRWPPLLLPARPGPRRCPRAGPTPARPDLGHARLRPGDGGGETSTCGDLRRLRARGRSRDAAPTARGTFPSPARPGSSPRPRPWQEHAAMEERPRLSSSDSVGPGPCPPPRAGAAGAARLNQEAEVLPCKQASAARGWGGLEGPRGRDWTAPTATARSTHLAAPDHCLSPLFRCRRLPACLNQSPPYPPRVPAVLTLPVPGCEGPGETPALPHALALGCPESDRRGRARFTCRDKPSWWEQRPGRRRGTARYRSRPSASSTCVTFCC